jgi:hypothetical protein
VGFNLACFNLFSQAVTIASAKLNTVNGIREYSQFEFFKGVGVFLFNLI